MTPEGIVDRARSCLGKGVTYGLGKGGMKPEAPHPWVGEVVDGKSAWLCDCSGFALWACGKSRYQPPLWYGTDMIVADAKNDGGIFSMLAWELALPGDLLVFPGINGHHGHVGVVTSSWSEGPKLVIHCSAGNFRRFNDAIQETEPSVWSLRADTLLARLKVAEPGGV